MHAASLPSAPDPRQIPVAPGMSRRRIVALGFTIAIHLLLLLLFIGLAPRLTAPPQAERTTVFTLEPDRGSAPAPSAAPKSRERAARPRAPTPERTPPPPPPPPTPVPDETPPPLKMIEITRNDYRAADIGGLPRGAGPAAMGESGAGTGSTAGDSTGAGTGPGGEKLYNAEWYREPTQAELGTYLPPGLTTGGWGEIACRTVKGNRVEDCREIGNAPQGSGLARAIRNAAWQFRVRPPRIGGRPMVGEWVRIHIDITEGGKRR